MFLTCPQTLNNYAIVLTCNIYLKIFYVPSSAPWSMMIVHGPEFEALTHGYLFNVKCLVSPQKKFDTLAVGNVGIFLTAWSLFLSLSLIVWYISAISVFLIFPSSCRYTMLSYHWPFNGNTRDYDKDNYQKVMSFYSKHNGTQPLTAGETSCHWVILQTSAKSLHCDILVSIGDDVTSPSIIAIAYWCCVMT